MPKPEIVDRVIQAYKDKVYVSTRNGDGDQEYMAAIALLEWATDRSSTAKWIPIYVSKTIEDAENA